MTAYETLVCPECGSHEFSQSRCSMVEETVRVEEIDGIRWREHVREEITDGGDEPDELHCDDCGQALFDDDLITKSAYNGELES